MVIGLKDRLVRGPLLPLAIFVAALVERMVWLYFHGLGASYAEAYAAAQSFSKTGIVGGVFSPSEGPSAHLNPILPVFGGLIYRAFGTQGVAAELVLAAVSVAFAFAAAAVTYAGFGIIGVSRKVRLAGLALFLLLPLNLELETVTFRLWEGSLASFVSAVCFYLVVRADRDGEPSWKRISAVSFIAALSLFINPALGVADFCLAGLLFVRRLPAKRWPGMGMLVLLVAAATLAPWTARNYYWFHEFVPLRSSGGLELAMAFHSGLERNESDQRIFIDRMEQIHPYKSPAAYRRLQADGGEINYARRLGAEARGWIAAHPGLAARQAAKHLGQFYFPQEWQYRLYWDSSRSTYLKMAFAWILSLLGLLGALAIVTKVRGRLLYGAVLIIAPALPYVVAQPILRYRYVIAAPSAFMAIWFLFWLAGLRSSRRGSPVVAEA